MVCLTKIQINLTFCGNVSWIFFLHQNQLLHKYYLHVWCPSMIYCLIQSVWSTIIIFITPGVLKRNKGCTQLVRCNESAAASGPGVGDGKLLNGLPLVLDWFMSWNANNAADPGTLETVFCESRAEIPSALRTSSLWTIHKAVGNPFLMSYVLIRCLCFFAYKSLFIVGVRWFI